MELKQKSNVLRGWPAVVIAQALDYSNSPRFPEYSRRFITTNPTMTLKNSIKQSILSLTNSQFLI